MTTATRRLCWTVSIAVLAAVCFWPLARVHVEVIDTPVRTATNDEPGKQPSGQVPFIPLAQQERMFFEGDFRLDEEIPVELAPLQLPGVAVSVKSIRLYDAGRLLRGAVSGAVAYSLPLPA